MSSAAPIHTIAVEKRPSELELEPSELSGATAQILVNGTVTSPTGRTPLTREDIVIQTRSVLDAFLDKELKRKKEGDAKTNRSAPAPLPTTDTIELHPSANGHLSISPSPNQPLSRAESRRSPANQDPRGFEADQSSSSSGSDQQESSKKPRKKKTMFNKARDRLRAIMLRRQSEEEEMKRKGSSIGGMTKGNWGNLAKTSTNQPPVKRTTSDSSGRRHVIVRNFDGSAKLKGDAALRKAAKKKKSDLKWQEENGSLPSTSSNIPRRTSSLKDNFHRLVQRLADSPVGQQFPTCVDWNPRLRHESGPYTRDYAKFGADLHKKLSSASSNVPHSDAQNNNSQNVEATVHHPEDVNAISVVDSGSDGERRKQALYGEIADRLLQIVDEFMSSKELALRMQRLEIEGVQDEDKRRLLQEELIESQRSDQSSMVANAILNSIPNFTQIMQQYVESNTADPQLNLALVFYWTSLAVRQLGRTASNTTISLLSHCVEFIVERFSDWIIDQGGYSLAVSVTDESSGEVD